MVPKALQPYSHGSQARCARVHRQETSEDQRSRSAESAAQGVPANVSTWVAERKPEARWQPSGGICREYSQAEDIEETSMNKYFAELIGTFVLVFGGVGSAVLAGSHIGFVGIAFAFGLSLLAMVYTIGPISGCHINPAVTLGVLLARKIGTRDAVMYVVAQIFGAIVASALILFVASGVEGGYNF